MEIDQQTAAALGFPKLKYAWVERERRWLCREIPMSRVVRAEAIVDLYVTDTPPERVELPQERAPKPGQTTGLAVPLWHNHSRRASYD